VRTLFIGGTKRGWQTLAALIDHGANIAGVISLRQDEHEKERYEEPIRRLAEEHAIPLLETRWMKDRNYPDLITREIRPDLIVVVGCRILLPREVYEIPPRGTVAVHDSLLPEYRGFAPLNWAIINGEDHTGVTLFYLNESMDGGDIIAQRRVPIGPDDTAPQVYEQVCQATIDLVIEAYPRLSDGTAPRRAQFEHEGSVTCRRTPDDGLIDWTQPTVAIANRIRGLTSPYPGAFTFHQGQRLTVWRARIVETAPRYAGRIAGAVAGLSKNEGYVDVLTGDGVLRLLEVEREGASRTAAADVITSIRAKLGLDAIDLLRRIQVLDAQAPQRASPAGEP
jgi:methionyl-tRNA formyltransferase